MLWMWVASGLNVVGVVSYSLNALFVSWVWAECCGCVSGVVWMPWVWVGCRPKAVDVGLVWAALWVCFVNYCFHLDNSCYKMTTLCIEKLITLSMISWFPFRNVMAPQLSLANRNQNAYIWQVIHLGWILSLINYHNFTYKSLRVRSLFLYVFFVVLETLHYQGNQLYII